MSSRAAAGRKRITTGEPPRPSSSKGFFSRSKSNVASSPLDGNPPSPDHSPILPPITPFVDYRDSHSTRPYHIPDNLPGASSGGLSRRPEYGLTPSSSVTMVSRGGDIESGIRSAYPHPGHEARIPRHGNMKADSPLGTMYRDHQQDSVTFVEATYQPPPPIVASYQPPPPVSSAAHDGPRPLPSAPRKHGERSIDDLKKIPLPPNHIPPTPPNSSQSSLPSPHSSPRHVPRHLPASSPTPSELPTYSSSGHENYSSEEFEQVALRIATENISNIPYGRGMGGEAQRHFNYSERGPYPSPPSSQHPHLSPSSFNASLTLSPSQSAMSLPSDNDPNRPLYRGLLITPTPTGPPSPLLMSGFQLSPTPSRMAPSISESSSSDSAGSTSSGGAGNAPPTFYFPGSRSVAKPKVSKKTGTPAIIMKGKKSKPEDTMPHSLPNTPTPNSQWHYLHTPPSPGIVGPDGQIILPQRPHHPNSIISEGMSPWSEDSNLAVAGNSRGAGSGSEPSTPNTPGTSSTKPPPPILFPVGRSRAQPSKVPQGIKLKSFTPRPRASSSASSGKSSDELPSVRSRFMGIPLTRKKKSSKASDSTGSGSLSSGSSIGGGSIGTVRPGSSSSNPGQSTGRPGSPNVDAQAPVESRPRITPRVGSYPLDPYDLVLLDNDRHTGELLFRLNPTGSPSFHNYGNAPPVSVLDLGCGQGHWVVDAAIAWKGYGTRVTGYDMVDISRGLLPWAIEQGVVNNVRFMRGNFLKQQLPFADNTFDLVRMSCLALCIAADAWPFILQEVCRVMEPGGRLELIDDTIVFPYGKFSTAIDFQQVASAPPRLDITIPSASFSTFSIYDEQTTNPGLGDLISADDDEDVEGLYDVEEDDGEVDDTATLNGREPERSVTPAAPRVSGRRKKERRPNISSRAWNRAHATSGDLEALFEHMLSNKFGIRKDLDEFILDLMKEVFGHARQVKTMNLTLAPPEPSDVNTVLMSPRNTTGRPPHPLRREATMGLSQSPGLVLWPSTFLPMDQAEIEIHASKHLRILLSCKNFLVEHALEATEDEEIDEGSVLEALWEYERFLRHRFNPPPPSWDSSSSKYGSDLSDTASLRESIAESVSSDGRVAMFEIASEIGQHFEWQSSEESLIDPSTQRTPIANATQSPVLPSPNPRRDSAASNPAPIYSRDELTHVRTFRVYEAIKLDRSMLGFTS